MKESQIETIKSRTKLDFSIRIKPKDDLKNEEGLSFAKDDLISA